MLSQETSKKEIDKPITITVRNETTGTEKTIRTNFFIGSYTVYNDNASAGSAPEAAGTIMEGTATVLDEYAMLAALEQKTVPKLKENIHNHIQSIKRESGFGDDDVSIGIISILGGLF